MPTTYKKIIDCYSGGAKLRLHKMLDLCTSIHQYVYGIEIIQNNEQVKCCVPACDKECFAIRRNINSHQIQVPKSILNAFEQRMKVLPFNRTFTAFEDLFEYVAQNSGLKNGHCLLVYDFCLRKGHHMNPQLEPKDFVYLFRGAREGAEYILGAIPSGVYKQPTALFQHILSNHLSSMEIEDFLCVCKTHIKYLGAYRGAQGLLKKYGITHRQNTNRTSKP